MPWDERSFRLTPRVLELGRGYVSGLRLPDMAEPHMQELVQQTRESTSMAMLDGHEIVYVARVPTQRIMTISLAVGSRLPAYPTSMGRMLLAHLDPPALERYLGTVELSPLTPRTVTDVSALRARILEARQRGWAAVDQELEEGVRSIAVPVRDRQGRALVALNVSGHSSRVTMKRLRQDFLPLLLSAAKRIEGELPA